MHFSQKKNTYRQKPGKAPPQAPNNKKKDNSPKERPPKGNRPTQAKHLQEQRPQRKPRESGRERWRQQTPTQQYEISSERCHGQMGFSQQYVEWIMMCVELVDYLVIVNKDTVVHVIQSRGLRQ